MNRRDFLQAGALAAGGAALPQTAQTPQTPGASTAETRASWIARLTKIADPVLTHLAKGTLKAQMPCEAAAGVEAARRKFTHLEAFGRLLAGMAPWIELGEDNATARYADLARRALISATTPGSPDFLNFNDGGQALVDTAFLAQAILR